MSLSENGGGMSAADVAAVMGANGNGNFGWNDGSFWLIVLFLFAWMGNGWGNGFGGNNNAVPYMTNDVQRGFDQQALINGINNITNGQNTLAMGLQNCCCENRAGIADLKYTVSTEACADRQAVSDALNNLTMSMNNGFQSIYNQMCMDKMESKNEVIAELRSQLSMKDLQASQTAQTAQILANNAAQTAALEQYLNPAPIPAYVVQNPNCCTNGIYNGCGCNA